MKRKLQLIAILFSVIAALLTWKSNTDSGRIMYKEYCLPRLSGLGTGMDKLFQQPNKYRNKDYPQRYSGKWNFFYLQNGKDKEFKAMKDFILSNHYTRQLSYEIKGIMQYQAAHSGGDAMNPQFNARPVFFIKKTESNKELDFGKTTDADLLIKDAMPITTEAYLTQNLDAYFGNCLRTGALAMIIIASALNSIGALIGDEK
jgi:hypothetical protein